MAPSTVSLKRIAEAADVSITTVSRVLRNRGEISEETRQKVLRIAEQLRYRPNLAAQSIYSGRTNIIGVIIPAASNFDIRIAFGIHDELAERDIVPITLWTGGEQDQDKDRRVQNVLKQIHHLVDRRVDGVILRPENRSKHVYLREIRERNIPLVAVDRDILGEHADFVGTDDAIGASLVAEHLISLGHRHLGHLAGPASVSTACRRRQAFEETIAAVPEATCVTLEDPTYGFDIQIPLQLLQREPRPTAIFAANDIMAKHIYNAARRLGLRIPEDLSVVGFADLEIAELMDPPLTTIRQHPYEMGRLAARLVLQRRDDEHHDEEPKSILLKPELILRHSTHPCP